MHIHMSKILKNPGTSMSKKAEIQNISNHGIWVLINNEEFFMPFTTFPWFLKATIEQIYELEFLHEHHLHTPSLDIDIDLETIKHPDLYPLKYS